jgi:hypothetical protein
MKNLSEERLSGSEDRLSTADFVSAGNGVEKRQETVSGQPQTANAQTDTGAPGPLLPADVVQDLRGRWGTIQAGFVDEPKAAVEQADELVAMAMKRLAEGFAEQRNTLEHQWDNGSKVSTEDLRVALRKYRAFFERLLAIQAQVS